jgi:tellurite resistance protein TehA-like permease
MSSQTQRQPSQQSYSSEKDERATTPSEDDPEAQYGPRTIIDRPHRLTFTAWLGDHMRWSWFTCTQSTGGAASLLHECPKQFAGLETIGRIMFILQIVLFLTFNVFMIWRWATNPGSFKKSFTTKPECNFFGSYWLSCATVILNMHHYGGSRAGPWIIVALRVLFWLYAAISLTSTTVHMAVIFRNVRQSHIDFAPPMFLLILNAMLTGTIAATIAGAQPNEERVAIMVAGVAYQGLGWLVCMLLLTMMLGNLLENGWPAGAARPGLFIMVGTSGFTIVALIGIAEASPTGYGYFGTHPLAGEILTIVATWIGIFLWLFSCWWFFLSLIIILWDMPKWAREENGTWWKVPIHYTNTWWAVIFPNVGWALGTVYLGRALESEAILWVSVAMIIGVEAVWVLNIVAMGITMFKSLFVDARIKLA